MVTENRKHPFERLASTITCGNKTFSESGIKVRGGSASYPKIDLSFTKRAICDHDCSLQRCVTMWILMMHKSDLSYATSDVNGNQLPHSFVSHTEVYSSLPASVTISSPSNTQTRLPAFNKTDIAVNY